MAFTFDDLREFTSFAEEQLKVGSADSIVQIVNRWERERATLAEQDGASACMFDPTRSLNDQLADGQAVVFGARDLHVALEQKSGVTTAELFAKLAALDKDAGR